MLLFNDFIDVSYALWGEDQARVNPLQGLEEIVEKIVPGGRERESIPTQREVKNQNEQAMASLEAMMSGVQGISRRRKSAK